jgi:hypothetical protein
LITFILFVLRSRPTGRLLHLGHGIRREGQEFACTRSAGVAEG